MIDSIIIAKALQQTSRLTLPEFGTLLKKNEGEIVFSQFLRTDDRVFASIVMNSYQVGSDEASQMVSAFVGDIITRIASNGQYILPELGYFVSDACGVIKFKSGIPPQQPEQVATPSRPQMEPQPIVGIPQQQPYPQQRFQQQPVQQPRQFRQQAPYGPRPQQVIPQRRPQQGSQQCTQSRPQQMPQQQMQGRPPIRRNTKPARKKTDFLLIFAIIVALGVLCIIVYSLVFAESVSDII